MRIRRLALLALVLGLVAWMPHERTAPNRWALIIGISDYMHFGDELGGDLPGASWDARRMRDVLIARWGFEPDRIRMVLDRDATRARILAELMEWLPAVVKDNDHVLFFFAGHGSQTWNEDGTAADGLDQTICPTDVLKGDPTLDIRDKELGGLLRSLPTPNVVAILDNCHSGTGTRAVTPFARPRSLGRDVTTDIARPTARAGLTAVSHHERDILEIAAAQSWEVAVDAEWPGVGGAPATHGGAFTTTMVRHLWRVPRNTSYEEIFHLTAEDLKRQRFAQQPLLTKTGAEQQGFGYVAGSTAGSDNVTVPVRAVSGRTVELGGGSGAGMTVGSIYRVGPAILRITAVSGDAAQAELATGQSPARGAGAELVAYEFPASPLRVSVADVDASTAASLRNEAARTPILQLVSSPRDFAHLIVRPAEQGYVIIGMDGAIRHSVPLADRSAAVRLVAELLRHEAGTHQLGALDNPGQAQPLDFRFAGGVTSFRVGSDVRFEVRVPRDGYLTIVDLGTDGRITVLYPNEDTPNNNVRTGQLVTLPAGREVFFQAQEPAGRGIVRAFLTQQPMSLTFREGEPEEATRVLDALRRAAGAAPITGSRALPTTTWLTAALIYTIEP